MLYNVSYNIQLLVDIKLIVVLAGKGYLVKHFQIFESFAVARITKYTAKYIWYYSYVKMNQDAIVKVKKINHMNTHQLLISILHVRR